MRGRTPFQSMAANRTNGRRLIRLLLSRFLQKFALQSLGLTKNLLFHISQGPLRGPNALIQPRRQTRLPFNHGLGKRLVTAVGLRNRFQTAVVHPLVYTTASLNLPPQILICARVSTQLTALLVNPATLP